MLNKRTQSVLLVASRIVLRISSRWPPTPPRALVTFCGPLELKIFEAMYIYVGLNSPSIITSYYHIVTSGSIMHVREHWRSPIIGSRARRLVIGASHRGTLNPVDTLPDPQLHHLSQYSNWISTQKLYLKFQTLPHIPHPAWRYLSVPHFAPRGYIYP